MLRKPHTTARFGATQIWLIAFLVHATLCAAFAYSPRALSLKIYEDLVKTLVFALAMGLGFHGMAEEEKFIAGSGHKIITGISTTMMSDNDHFAVGLLMIVPILYCLYQNSALL